MFRPLPTDRKVKRGWWKMRHHPIIIHVERSMIFSANLMDERGFYSHTYLPEIGNISNAQLQPHYTAPERPNLSVVK